MYNKWPTIRSCLAGLAVALALTSMAGSARACVFGSIIPRIELSADASTEDAPGTFYGWGRPVGIGFGLCSEPSLFQTDANISGFTYVELVEIEGVRYPAYQMSSTSPLIIFRMENAATGHGEHIMLQRTNSLPLELNANHGGYVFIKAGAVARRGMTSQSIDDLSEIKYWVRDAQQGPQTSSISFNIRVTGSTCGIHDTSVALENLSPGELDATGSTAHQRDFMVDLVCPADNIPVRLTLSDADNPAGTGSRLTPVAASTAKGVSLELLRNNAPVVFGQQWNYGNGQNGVRKIPLSARYYRETGDLVPGRVEGKAFLTADYN